MALRKITREDVDRLRMPDETPQRTVAEMNVNPFDLGPQRFGDARGMVDPRMLEALAWNQEYDVDAREAEVQAARDRIAAALVAQQGMPPPLAAAAADQMVSNSSVFGGDSAQGVNPGSGADGVTGLSGIGATAGPSVSGPSATDGFGGNAQATFGSGAPPSNSNPDDSSSNTSVNPGGFVTSNASMMDKNSTAWDGAPTTDRAPAENDPSADREGLGLSDVAAVAAAAPAATGRDFATGDFGAYSNPTPSGFTNAPSVGMPTGAFTPGGSFTPAGAPAPTFSAALPDFPTSFDEAPDSVVSVTTTPVAAPPADAPLNPNTPHITVTPNTPYSPAPTPTPSGRAPIASAPTPDFVAPTAPGFDVGSVAPGGTGFGPGAYGGYTGGPDNTGGFGAGYSGSADMGNTQGAQGFTSGFSAGFEAGMAAMSGGFDTGSGAGDGAGAGAGAGAGDSGGSSAGGSDGASGGVG